MDRPIPQRISIQSPIKQLRIERIKGENNVIRTSRTSYKCTETRDGSNVWHIWLTANGDFTLGTFLRLCDDGSIQRVTWHEDGSETVFNIKEE
jgi:hypothetical protein